MQATQYLTAHDWNVNSAATDYFASLDETSKAPQESSTDTDDLLDDRPPAPTGGGRTLGGSSAAPVPSSAAPSTDRPSQPPAQKKKFATLGDLASSGPARGPAPGDDDDSDDPDYDPNLFAGGEKSGLAVQNPDDLKRKILERARKAQPRPGGDDDGPAPPPRQSAFTGAARTLGGEGEESRVIEDPSAQPVSGQQQQQQQQQRPRAERVERTLHFWTDGFSVDDGPLYRADDPQNAQILALIRQGRAPLALMGVRQAQEVDVKLEEHDTKYVRPKKKGSG